MFLILYATSYFFSITFKVAFCTGLFQMGSGKLLAVWTAIFVNKNETKELWGECAEVLKQAGIDGLYSDVVHLRDRHTGCAVFEEKLQISRGMYCVPHILRNILLPWAISH